MTDEIMTELWKIKDDLSKEAGKDMKAFCRHLNEEARRKGTVFVNHSNPLKMQVADEVTEYKIRASSPDE
jgi:hypothetical protein